MWESIICSNFQINIYNFSRICKHFNDITVSTILQDSWDEKEIFIDFIIYDERIDFHSFEAIWDTCTSNQIYI